MLVSVLTVGLFFTAVLSSVPASAGKPPTPKLSYSPTSLNFGTVTPGYTGSKIFEIWNSGTGTLSYSFTETSSWITGVSPSSGTSTGERDRITVSIDTTGMSDGAYSAPVSISSNGGSGSVKIYVTVKGIPKLSYNPASLDFGTVAPGYAGSKTFEVWNSGTGTLTYSFSESSSWITGVNPPSGTSTGEHDVITVSIDTTGMSDGSYDAPVSISSNGGSGSVAIYVTVVTPPNPILSYDPASLDFGTVAPGYVGNKTFEIWNSGSGTLSYSFTESSPWITSVDPPSGTSTGEHDIITVSMDTTGMSDGSYSSPVSVSSNGGNGSVAVYVTILTPPMPLLSYNPSILDFGTVAPGYVGNKTFEVWNSGAGTLTYSFSEISSWISSVIPPGGTSTGEHDVITVSIDMVGMPDGVYDAPVSISSDGGSGSVAVHMTIKTTPIPLLSYNPASLDFGTVAPGYAGNKTFEVWNSGTGTLSYSFSENSSWITSIDPMVGTSTGEHDAIKVSIDTAGMPDGSFNAPVSISSDGGSGSVAIFVTVQAPPPDSNFSFGLGGDMGWNETWRHGRDTLKLLAGNTTDDFFLHLGDLSYSTTPGTETAWCDWVKSYVGTTYPYQLLAGNHEDNDPVLIDNFAQCLPDRLASVGTYGKEYYFDYPAMSPLARFILLSPGLNFTNGGIYYYTKGSPHLQWAIDAIDGARASGIKWVIVGTHMPCVSMNNKSWAKCYMGPDLFNTLLEKKVDMIMTGHSHAYERGKQLICATPDVYRPECVVDSDDSYQKGAGSAYVIAGTTGDVMDTFNPSDPEREYFVKGMDANTPHYGWGFAMVTITSTSLTLRTVFKTLTGEPAWYDMFTIS